MTAGIIGMRVLFEGGSYLRKYGRWVQIGSNYFKLDQSCFKQHYVTIIDFLVCIGIPSIWVWVMNLSCQELEIQPSQSVPLQISVQTASDWFWVCSGTEPQEPRIRCNLVTLVTQGKMQQRKEQWIFISKFYVDSKKVCEKFLHRPP